VQKAERHHWLNTIVAILDGAFYLTEEEQALTISIVNRLLTGLRIPDRAEPGRLPAAVALEVTSGFYTVQLYSNRDSGMIRPVRMVTANDLVVPVEAWAQALLGLILSAYPGLDPAERMISTKVFTDLLTGIGVPHRAAAYFPDDVARAYRSQNN
jgi:hypothetical protein